MDNINLTIPDLFAMIGEREARVAALNTTVSRLTERVMQLEKVIAESNNAKVAPKEAGTNNVPTGAANGKLE